VNLREQAREEGRGATEKNAREVQEMKRILTIALALALALSVIGLADGALRVTFSWPTHIDPAVGSDFSSSSSFVNLYDTLVYPTTSGDPIPHVAESWDVPSS
jgi:ABC-type transport system substrate-binding protein